MGHNLDITDGVASFASARLDAWHRLGTVLPNAMTAEEALRESHLADWNIRKTSLMAAGEANGDHDIPVSTHYSVIRDNPVVQGQQDVLGIVGPSYQIMQNEALIGLLDTLVDESGANYETAGALNGGRQVFVSMKLPEHIQVGGVDPIDQYLTATTSHDGSTSTTLMVTPVRVVCENTLNLAFGNSASSMRVRHTSGADRLLRTQARQTLDFTFKYLDGFQQEAEQLINTTLTQTRFEQIVTESFGAGEDAAPATQTRSQNKVDEMVELFADAYTHEGLRNTAWAGMNALTEWYDHFAPVRAQDQDAARAKKALFDPQFKDAARKRILQEV